MTTNKSHRSSDREAELYISNSEMYMKGHQTRTEGKRTKYEHEFCQLGRTRYIHHDMNLAEFVLMITTTISVVSIVALIVSVAGFSLISTAYSRTLALGQTIIGLISRAAVLNQMRLHMTFSESCAEFWESDPYYPGGGFWFLGYSANPDFFNWYIY